MCSTHDVYCKKCKAHLAWWSMFDNIQYADEYECTGTVRKKNNGEVWQTKDKKGIIYGHPDLRTKQWQGAKRIVMATRPCATTNETIFCGVCAKKLKYICPGCGGKIKRTRKR